MEPTPQQYGLKDVERAPVVSPGPSGTFGVVEALCKVMAALPNIGKADRSPEGYSYRGIEAITRHVQALFAEHGVLTIPQSEVLYTVPSPAMKEGWQDVIMRVEWTLAGLDGSTITAITNGIGRDKSDKGSNKAQTQALKYLLLPLLLIADGKDDADSHSYEDGRADEPLERFTTPQGELIEVWPGELSAKNAKGRVAKACGGDKDAAAAAWKSAGFEGRWKVTEAELAKALTEPSQAESDTRDAGPAALEPKVLAMKAGKVFHGIDAPKGQKTKTVERLRHAVVWLATDGRTPSLNECDTGELVVVQSWLRDIEAGDIGYRFDPAGVTFEVGVDEPVEHTVLWDEFEQTELPGHDAVNEAVGDAMAKGHKP